MNREEILDFYLRWAWVKLAKVYNAEAERRGITLSVGYALLSIEKEGTPSTKLGPRMGMEPTSLSRTLKGMEEKDVPHLKKTFLAGLHFLIPIFVLIYLLVVLRFTASYSIFYATIALILVNLINKLFTFGIICRHINYRIIIFM